ncbi:transmembrane protein 139 [Tachyglossus aculeatus]|uniref:transmembrane protein 139 n=1 Tax=Tachyglossus aculeatus TaxID=9261 RepID=UPI0018F33CB2|nr:transmembrane protein 139 [Tachyglossus aculeatus]
MVPAPRWKQLTKPLLFLSCATLLVGFTLLSLEQDVTFLGFIFLIAGGLLFLSFLLACFGDWWQRQQHPLMPSPSAQETGRDNAAFEVPTYEEAMESGAPAPPNSPAPGDPPAYSTLTQAEIKGGGPVRTMGWPKGLGSIRRMGSEGSSLALPRPGTGLQPRGQRAVSDDSALRGPQGLPWPEPLTPPPAYIEIDDEGEDSVFYEDAWSPT